MGGEFNRGIRVGRRRGKERGGKVMEMDVSGGDGVPTVDTELRLAVVGGRGNVVDGDVVGGDEAGELEELVEMALCWKWHHHHHNLALL